MKRTGGFSSIITRAAAVVSLGFMLLAMGGVAHAANRSTNKNKAGTLKITAATEIGGTILQPGRYEVKPVNTPEGAAVEFARWIDNPYAQEALPHWEREVVATVNATPQMLEAVTGRTELLLAPDSHKAIGVQIRGANVEYMLGQ